ncbi:hypothetical protein BHE74_00049732 [Ensete ventricosum]|nr:hypothetical protein BHE74_00049732 [Ensete ventricosum]
MECTPELLVHKHVHHHGVRLGKSAAGVVEGRSEGASTGVYIAGVVDHPYLATWLPMWLTMLPHTSTMSVVLAVGHASTGKGVGLTCVRPVVRPVAPPYLRPASFPRWVGHVGGPVVRGRADVAVGSPSAISFFLPWEDLLEVLDEGAEDGVFGSSWAGQTEQELRNLNGAEADPTERGLGNLNSAGADPTERGLGNLNGATRADPIEHGLGNGAGADSTERRLGNLNGAARADPTEQELGNCDIARADPTEQKLGNWNSFYQG